MTLHHYQFCIMAQYLALAIGYAIQRNWPYTGYWLSAAGIVASATFGMGR